MDEVTITDEILEKARGDLNLILKNKKLPKQDRLFFEIQQYFLLFLITDHKKIRKLDGFISFLDWISNNKKTALALFTAMMIGYHILAQGFSASGWGLKIIQLLGF